MIKESVRKVHSIIYALAFFTGLMIFIWLWQMNPPWKFLSLAGIFVCSSLIVYQVNSFNDLARIFDLRKVSGHAYYYGAISILIGLLWALIFRDYLPIPLLPSRITSFALTAMAIGSVEEIIFRGYIQQKLRSSGMVVSILGASALHTFYKCFLFLVLPAIHPTDYFVLLTWTFPMGCLLGLLKEYSRNTLVPLSGHATFDLITYGDGAIDSWWVWL